MKPGGARAIVAENLLLKQQLLVAGRTHQRAPRLSILDRRLFGFWSLLLSMRRIVRAAIILKPSTLLRFHAALVQCKYHRLYTPGNRTKPGPQGPSQELIHAIVELKRRNPHFGCPRIAQQIAYTFDVEIDKDVVRRVLVKHDHPGPGQGTGPSWLTVIGHAKDSLWSVDLCCCESIRLQTHWILVVMDQFTRRIIGFAVQAGDINARVSCRMVNQAICQQGTSKYLTSDNDPLFLHQQWQANLRILDIEEIKTVPAVPLSHPFIEWLIGTVRREFLDQVLFCNVTDRQRKLETFQHYYNHQRRHTSCDGRPPAETVEYHAALEVFPGHHVAMDFTNCPSRCDL